jgi:hypothetical protein
MPGPSTFSLNQLVSGSSPDRGTTSFLEQTHELFNAGVGARGVASIGSGSNHALAVGRRNAFGEVWFCIQRQ